MPGAGPGNGIPAKVPGDLEAGSRWITFWVTTVYGLCVGTSSMGSWELVLRFELMSRVECERGENDFLCLLSPFRPQLSCHVTSFRPRV